MIPPFPVKKCSLFALSTLGHLLYSDVFEGEEMMQVPAQSGRWSCRHFLLFPHNCFFHSIFSPPHDNPSDEFVFLLELIITLAFFFPCPELATTILPGQHPLSTCFFTVSSP
jgi:hypothetical protein